MNKNFGQHTASSSTASSSNSFNLSDLPNELAQKMKQRRTTEFLEKLRNDETSSNNSFEFPESPKTQLFHDSHSPTNVALYSFGFGSLFGFGVCLLLFNGDLAWRNFGFYLVSFPIFHMTVIL
jgi:hypothetical protein